MKRILVIGANASGKTTFSRRLAQAMNLPLVHLDKLFWRDNWSHASDAEFDELLLKELVKPAWIIDGNISRTLPLRLTYCDAVIWFDFYRARCLWGAVRRVIRHYGKSRADMGGHCPERFDFAFLKTILFSHGKNRARFRRLLRGADGVRVIRVRTRRDAERVLGGVGFQKCRGTKAVGK
ncbi:MAG: topology modulation protein [Oscillospiraceae bacterium]